MPMLALVCSADAAELERLLERLADLGGHRQCAAFVVRRSVSSTANSSPPSRAIVSAVAQHALQPPAHLDQQAVAVVVAERVVDLLELVEVHHEQRRPVRPMR